MRHRFARTTVATAVLTVFALAASSTAGSTPVDTKRAEAERLQQQIDANGHRIAALGERYNGAQIAYQQAGARIADAQRRLEVAAREARKLRSIVRDRAVAIYKRLGSGTPLSQFDVSDANTLSRRSKYAQAASERDGTVIERYRRAQDRLESEQVALRQQQELARQQRDDAEQARAAIESANAGQRQLLSKVKGEIATLMAEEQRKRDAAARAAAIARTTRSSPGGARRPAGGAVDPGAVGGNFPQVPTSGGVAAVIAYARAQLGKPYVFATSGPNTFDCSGLTMMAWRQAGVSMAHFSGAQFNAFPHVSTSQLQPGDLVFKGPGGRDHVALYIGSGMQIAATHTGDFVRLQPLSSNLSGAVRPG